MTDDQELDLKYAADWLDFARRRPSRATYDFDYPDCHIGLMNERLKAAGKDYADIGTDAQEVDYLLRWGMVGECCSQYLMVEENDTSSGPDVSEESQRRLGAAIKLKDELGLDDQRFEEMLEVFRAHKRGVPLDVYQELRITLEPQLCPESQPDPIAAFFSASRSAVADLFPDHAEEIMDPDTSQNKHVEGFCVDVLASSGIDSAHFLHRLPRDRQLEILDGVTLEGCFAQLPEEDQTSLRTFYQGKFANPCVDTGAELLIEEER